MQKEMQEFKECTFKPAVHPVPPKEKEPVVIKGLGRHLELQDLAKQMKKDHEDWERKVFFSHVRPLTLATCERRIKSTYVNLLHSSYTQTPSDFSITDISAILARSAV